MTGNSNSGHGAPRPASSASRILALLGRIVAFALIVGAGVAGWFGVEEFELSIGQPGSAALAESLPELGDGLPEARLQSPAPWRRFALTYQDAAQTNRFWVDLDSWQLRIESTNADATSAAEINGDRSYTRAGVDGEWVERNGQETRDLASWLMSGIGPFVLTDLVPPNSLGFTTLELEGTSRDERVYEVVVDAATLQEQHPLAHQRWTAATRIVNDASGVYRIRVREDGYIVRIDGETSSVQWEVLDGAVVFFSPMGLEAAPTPATAPPAESSVPATAAVAGD